MIFINHRVNTIEQLASVPFTNGIEIDVRYHEDDLILHHDPYGHHKNNPTYLEKFLSHWKHDGPMILNIKTEGIELECIKLMQTFEVKNWFFLDMSMPYFAKFSQYAIDQNKKGFGPKNLAVRFSEREPIEYALAFAGKASWVWVDCFNDLPLDERVASKLQDAGFSLCLVSPELQNHSTERIAEFRKKLRNIKFDAVCTKFPELWGQ